MNCFNIEWNPAWKTCVCTYIARGVAGQGPRVVCERFLENKVHAALCAAGHEAHLRPAGGHCKPSSGVRGTAPKNFENPENLTHKKQSFSDWGEPQASPTVTCWLGFLSRYIYVYNINRDRVFMANKDQYKDRGAAEVFITGLYSP